MKGFTALLLAVSFAFIPTVFAEQIQGTITSVNADNKTITISPTNTTQGLPSEVKLNVNDEESFKKNGIQSLDQLAVGDTVIAEADKKGEDSYDVKDLQRATGAQGAGATAEQGAGTMGAPTDQPGGTMGSTDQSGQPTDAGQQQSSQTGQM